jgi:hypothetical protein
MSISCVAQALEIPSASTTRHKLWSLSMEMPLVLGKFAVLDFAAMTQTTIG